MNKSPKQPIALLIPGIAIPYSKAVDHLRENPIFRENCNKAGIDYIRNMDLATLRQFDQSSQDDWNYQKLAYVVNCSMCDIYKEKGIYPEFVVGYSLGLYVALYAAGHYSFESGWRILEKDNSLAKKLCSSIEKKYGMALILGLTEEEIRKLLFEEVGEGMEIAVYNGVRSFVIAGEKEKLEICIKKAQELGALGVKRIFTEHPYHTPVFKDISNDLLNFMKTFTFFTPVSKVLSLIDGKVIEKGDYQTIAKAYCTPLRFDRVIETLLNHYHISTFYEAGPHESMRKLVRYIDRKAIVYHLADGEG